MKAALLVALALTGCTAKASHGLMISGLVVATGGVAAPEEHTQLRPATISVGLLMFAAGWVLHQADHPTGGLAPSQRVYTVLEPLDTTVAIEDETLSIHRHLPVDHARFTR